MGLGRDDDRAVVEHLGKGFRHQVDSGVLGVCVKTLPPHVGSRARDVLACREETSPVEDRAERTLNLLLVAGGDVIHQRRIYLAYPRSRLLGESLEPTWKPDDLLSFGNGPASMDAVLAA